jgi:hypothetical protein
MRQCVQLDPESKCRFLDSLRSLGMKLPPVIPSGARSAESRNLHFSAAPRLRVKNHFAML